ncbi:outer membrane beta-barrel protein [Simiduia agarivorans]|uniref:OmpA-like transmembrane domain-containing protein n=1 Tax=Simiduia agarivorans (strain DSM 21679 / JCM 13881 / BCRC 17597 / SA1) TaxID=1117647 RepID=K4KH64_SIMAS|nr:outer membrane beta-barrel protein [Simiduia agarivorans]AFU98346.2 OmpA-like transmembrane domain-containing protein [Simiduia agarivorans SA1 = DSM 21679]
MKLNPSLSALALVAALMAAPVWAGNETGLYLGGSVGSAQLTYDSADAYIDDSDGGYKVFGGYNFGLVPAVDLGIEVSYTDFGDHHGNTFAGDGRFSNTAWQGHLVGGLNLGPVGLFAKAGVANWETRFSNDLFTGKDDGSDPSYGIGAKFQIDALQLRAEYERLTMDDADLDFYSIGAALTF